MNNLAIQTGPDELADRHTTSELHSIMDSRLATLDKFAVMRVSQACWRWQVALVHIAAEALRAKMRRG
jgi:hypothetical protein